MLQNDNQDWFLDYKSIADVGKLLQVPSETRSHRMDIRGDKREQMDRVRKDEHYPRKKKKNKRERERE